MKKYLVRLGRPAGFNIKWVIVVVTSLVFLGCNLNRSNNEKLSEKEFVEISRQLDSANSDLLTREERKQFADKAFKNLLEKKNDSLTRLNLFRVANRYYNNDYMSSYYSATHEVLKRSLATLDSNSIAKSYVYLGDFFKNSSYSDSCFAYYLKAEKIYKRLDSDDAIASVAISKAGVLWNQNDYFAAENAALEALRYLKNSEDNQKRYESYTLLGLVSNALSNRESSLLYLNRALETVKQHNLKHEYPLATTLNNIGNVYQTSGKNAEAIEKFEQALSEDGLPKENPKLYSILLDNLAYSKYKLNINDQTVLPLFLESIKIKDSIRFSSGIIFSKSRLAEYYYSKGKLDLAEAICIEALSEPSANSVDLLQPLKLLSSFKIDNSNIYSEQFIKISDSLQLAERVAQDKFARIQFETDEISQENDKLEARNRNLVFFFVGTVMIGLLLFVIRMQRAKNRELLLKQAQQKANEDIYNLMLAQQNNIEEGRIKEKKRIAQELHDGVLSRLFGARLNLDSLNRMEGGDARDKSVNYLNELKNIEQDIREISHDLNREKVVLINNFLAILNNLFEEQSSNFPAEVERDFDNSINWEKVSNNLKINIYRIFQEALQNINKYAQAKHINAALTQEGNYIRLDIADDGLGFAVDKKSKGIGLQNMISRTNECKGTFDIQSKKGKGTVISILFPIFQESSQKEFTQTTPAIA